MFSDARLRPWEMERFLPSELDALERFIEDAAKDETDAPPTRKGRA